MSVLTNGLKNLRRVYNFNSTDKNIKIVKKKLWF